MSIEADGHYHGVCEVEGIEKRTGTLNQNGSPRCLDCGGNIIDPEYHEAGSESGSAPGKDSAFASERRSPAPSPEVVPTETPAGEPLSSAPGEAVEEPEEAAEAEESEGLEAKTVEELREIAAELEIEGRSSMNKAELVAAIEAAEA